MLRLVPGDIERVIKKPADKCQRVLYLHIIQAGLADFLNVSRLEAFRTLCDVKSNFITFSEGFEAVALDSGEVNENVLATFLLNKTETLSVVEPFNFTLCHFPISFFLRCYAGSIVLLP